MPEPQGQVRARLQGKQGETPEGTGSSGKRHPRLRWTAKGPAQGSKGREDVTWVWRTQGVHGNRRGGRAKESTWRERSRAAGLSPGGAGPVRRGREGGCSGVQATTGRRR